MLVLIFSLILLIIINLFLLSKRIDQNTKDLRSLIHNKHDAHKPHISHIKGIPHGSSEEK